MKPIAFILSALLALTACSPGEQGLLTGAALGAAIDDDNRARGAIIGAAIGGVAGSLVEQYSDGTCLYRRADGSTYRAPCN
jgi:hypothetical protein